MINQFTCPYCETQVKNQNSLCDKCDSEYLGTHIGGRMEETCYCPICLSIKTRWKNLKQEAIKEEKHATN